MAQDDSADAVAAAECQHLVVTSPPPNPKTTREGCSILLDINNGDRLVFARLSPAATLKIGNKKCSLGPLLGCPFGSLFRVGNRPGGPCLSRCSHSTSGTSDNALQAIEKESITEESRDNRLLIDNNTAQNLSSDDIDALRSYGTGSRIKLSYTRKIIDAIHSSKLLTANFKKTEVFGLEIPTEIEDVPLGILDPVNTWTDETSYKETLLKLAGLFRKNFEVFANYKIGKDDKLTEEILAAGPKF